MTTNREETKVSAQTLDDKRVWIAEFTLPPKEGKYWRENGTVHIVASDITNALAVVLAEHPDADVWNIRNMSQKTKFLIGA
jgi:hypothetical protein